MSLPESTDIFVVGGGPAGLAAAIAARRRGFHVIAADPAIPPIDKACGEGIMPDGVAAARELGIHLDNLPAFRFHGIRFCKDAKSVQAPFPGGCGMGIRRTMLHDCMVRCAEEAGVHFAWGTGVTGISDGLVHAGSRSVRTRWIVGADGGNSQVRKWAGLDSCTRESRRFGFRRHYRGGSGFASELTGGFMELHWNDECQLYITPVADDEVCLVVISTDPRVRIDQAIAAFPAIARRLPAASTTERGAVSATRRLHAVCSEGVALIGDASGSVDAITGDGLFLLFQQSVALANAFEAGDLSHYQREHRSIARRPAFMSDLMLLLDRRPRLQDGFFSAAALQPSIFRRLLAFHVGNSPA
jgi:flavin-dependent dehydrogenase